ncbi:aminoglycoside phosphotransferase family protein [Roseicyclus persicicus]|uniref:Phosphotransferase n=1 Tax=Roseicyclus persicicus TaxID=2650661 RepID=A0A7X6JZY6_9RHOB|nr:phosphotransferase [Roseibacterium persicicum]NKX45283.1 phosphotransferase [Roseibacterium persicicum]
MTDPVAALLDASGWAGAARAALPGDASARGYLRLARGAETAILMQAPVATSADRDSLAAFLRVGAHLAALGLSAPAVIAADPAQGLVLMEDFGDATLARLLVSDPATARAGYDATAEALDRLALAPVPGWAARPDAEGQAAMIGLTLGFLPPVPMLADLPARLAEALATHAGGPPVLALRDCHADNLVWLPDRAGPTRVGLLDYQDALALPLGYDLASLLDDPRRDVPDAWRADLIARFATAHGLDRAASRLATLSLLRNLRILGIFHRLARDGKPRYRAFLPRTAALVARAVADPALVALRAPVDELLHLTGPWAEAAA